LLACNQLKLLTTHSLGSSPYLTPEVTELLKNKKNGFRVVVSQDDLRVVVAAAAACGSPHPPESQERTRTLSLSLSSSVFLPLPESSFSAAVLQGNPKDPTVLYRSPTRVPEGPNRPLKQAYKGIRRTPLVHCSSPSGNPKEPCIVCSSPMGSLKDFIHPSTTALQRESEAPGMGISGFLQVPCPLLFCKGVP